MNAFAFKSHTKSVPSAFNMYSQMNIQRVNNNVKYYQIRIFTNLEWCDNMVINHRTHSF